MPSDPATTPVATDPLYSDDVYEFVPTEAAIRTVETYGYYPRVRRTGW